MISFAFPRFALLSLIVACWIGLPVAAQTLPVDDNRNVIITSIGTENLRTGATTSTDDVQSPSVDTVSSFLPLGMTGFSGIPGSATAVSIKDGGIVRGSIRTGVLEPYSANVLSFWRQYYRKDADDASFNYLITDAYSALFHYGAAGFLNSTDISASFDFRILLDDSTVFAQHAGMASQLAQVNGFNNLLTDVTGPMSSTLELTGLDGLGRPHEASLSFDPYGGSIDLSSIPVGDVFGVNYQLELDASGSGGETEAVVRFSDPADLGGGISTMISGLTPVSGPDPGMSTIPEPGMGTIACLLIVSSLIATRRRRRLTDGLENPRDLRSPEVRGRETRAQRTNQAFDNL